MDYQSLSDEELLKLIADKNRQAFQTLYMRYARRLFEFACRKVPAEIAEEIVQDVFVRLWQKPQLCAQVGNTSAYLFAAVRYAWLNHFRQELIKEKFITNSWQQIETQATLYEHAVKEMQEVISKAIATLPEKTQYIFHLSRFEGLSHREIATKLSVSEKTIEYHICQALKCLRESLQPFLVVILLFIS